MASVKKSGKKSDPATGAPEEKSLQLLTQALEQPWNVICVYGGECDEIIEEPEFVEWRKLHREQHAECVELVLALSGEAAFGLADKVYHLKPGCCLVLTSRDEHDTGRSLTEKFIYCCIHFYPGYVYWELFELIGTDYCSMSIERLEWALQGGLRDDVEALVELPLDNSQKMTYLFHLLECARLQFLAKLPVQAPAPTPQPHLHYRIFAAMRRIDASRGKVCSADELAKQSGYSKCHFLRLFRKTSKQSFHDYVNRVRKSSYRELCNRGFGQKRIAEELGFSSPAALAHWKKRILN